MSVLLYTGMRVYIFMGAVWLVLVILICVCKGILFCVTNPFDMCGVTFGMCCSTVILYF
jgi:hypothetical protein